MQYPHTEMWRNIFNEETLTKLESKPDDVVHALNIVGNPLEALAISAKETSSFKDNYVQYSAYIKNIEERPECSDYASKCMAVFGDIVSRIEKEKRGPIYIEWYIVMLVPAVIHFWNQRNEG